MRVSAFGTTTTFGSLAAGDFFLIDANGGPEFCIKAQFPNKPDRYCVVLSGLSGRADKINIYTLQDHESVLHFPSAVVRPKISEGLQLAENYAWGSLVLATDGPYLVGQTRNGSLTYINLETGDFSSPQQDRINVATWEINVHDEIRDEWICVVKSV